MDIETASPPVSPSVVAAILMIQNNKVTSGTLLSTFVWSQLTLPGRKRIHLSDRYSIGKDKHK